MSYNNINEAIAKLEELEATIAAYNHAMGVMWVDAATAAPEDSAEGRGRTMQVLSGVVYKLWADPASLEAASYLTAYAGELDQQTLRRAELLKKGCEQTSRIPEDEYIAYQLLLNEADGVWKKAKANNDFASFAPVLEKIVEFNRKFAGYYNPDIEPYNALLNEYEEGLTMATLDEFFATLREKLVPVIKAIGETEQLDDSFLWGHFEVEPQRRFSDRLMESLGIDPAHCSIAETEHPFTSGFNTKDVRLTTHYYTDWVANSMYAVIHEGGHALYELGGDPAYDHTFLQGGVSMSLHESQSRFYENMVGRSRAYAALILPVMQEIFPQQMADVTAEQLYKAINKAEPSLIRIEADELTYANHIMVRYEIEKQLIAGTLSVADVPAEWNRLYKEYLGVDVPDDAKGCLQDSHWSGGSFGYFPSYALGSAYAAQMASVMQEQLGASIDELIARGEMNTITAWLKENIHRHGQLYKPGELLEKCCGKFDASYYTDYLVKKYSELYGLA